MQAVTKEINRLSLAELVRLQGDALKDKDKTIAKMEDMLQQQADALSRSRAELTACRSQLEVSAAVA